MARLSAPRGEIFKIVCVRTYMFVNGRLCFSGVGEVLKGVVMRRRWDADIVH